MRNNNSYNDLIAQMYPYNYQEAPNYIQTLNLTFQITDDCNLSCSYCYQIVKQKNVMPLMIAKKMIDLLLENNEQTRQYIDISYSDAIILDFIGGEPLLQINLINQIIEYFLKKVIEKNHPWQFNWMVAITSNGTLYFDPQVQHFLHKWKDKIALTISLDGDKTLHDSCRKFPNGQGSYDLVVKAVKHYMKYFQPYSMGDKVTLSPENICYTYNAIVHLIKLGYKQIYANCIYEEGWTNDHATIFYYQLKQIADYILNNNLENDIYLSLFEQSFFCPAPKEYIDNWCGGNGHMLALDWKGDIFPCIRYMESSLGDQVKPIVIGNVNIGFLSNQQQINNSLQLKSINRLSQSSKECIECPIAYGCSWCQAYNYQKTGNINHRVTYICCMHKARSLANAYYWNKKYKKNNSNIRFKIYLSNEEILKIINSTEELEELIQLAS